jgi:arylformamidase
VHTGTHVDAPRHFIDGGAGADAIALDALMGSAYVVDATGVRTDIDVRALEALALPRGSKRLLFKTSNSELWSRPGFNGDFIGLTADAASYLVQRGVRLIGADYLSVAPKSDPAPTHRVLLEAGVVVLEGLDLRQVEPGGYRLVCLPLLLVGSDGAPARAILVRD